MGVEVFSHGADSPDNARLLILDYGLNIPSSLHGACGKRVSTVRSIHMIFRRGDSAFRSVRDHPVGRPRICRRREGARGK
ncbi:MAG: hypothetical protein CM1200mP36_03140 [Gammaproteobacteria bacterium]|nr:MAG: hypothetical protein CM1200mP36_03140 [Gammaproteobacteria bacterium]